jgi:hypothetical protein
VLVNMLVYVVSSINVMKVVYVTYVNVSFAACCSVSRLGVVLYKALLNYVLNRSLTC